MNWCLGFHILNWLLSMKGLLKQIACRAFMIHCLSLSIRRLCIEWTRADIRTRFWTYGFPSLASPSRSTADHQEPDRQRGARDQQGNSDRTTLIFDYFWLFLMRAHPVSLPTDALTGQIKRTQVITQEWAQPGTASRAQEDLDEPGRFFERTRYRPRGVPDSAFITYLSVNTYDFRGGWHGNWS